ncbi:MAG: hypothetical protein QOI87_3574, partial [Bradyrhizobium sp.]|nr:hypothetical protein [Bradyrhizobium sp.]
MLSGKLRKGWAKREDICALVFWSHGERHFRRANKLALEGKRWRIFRIYWRDVHVRMCPPMACAEALNFRLRHYPRFGPHDFMGSASGLYDNALIGGTERLTEAGQRGLDEPRFEAHPCGLAVAIEFPGHSQRFQSRCDAPGCHSRPDHDAWQAPLCTISFGDPLDRGYEARIDRVLGALEQVRVPIIAAIAGACTGGGAGIAACCDIRI